MKPVMGEPVMGGKLLMSSGLVKSSCSVIGRKLLMSSGLVKSSGPVIGSGLVKSKEPVTGNLAKRPTGIGNIENEAMDKGIFKTIVKLGTESFTQIAKRITKLRL